MKRFRGFWMTALLAAVSLSLTACHGYKTITQATYVNEKDGKQSLELKVDPDAAKSVSSGYAVPLHGEFVLNGAQGQTSGTYQMEEKGFVLKLANGGELKFSLQPDDVVKDENGQTWKRTHFELNAGLARNRS